MFITVLGQHVSALIESSSDPSKIQKSYLEMFKMRCGIPNAYVLDITMYKMHVFDTTMYKTHFIHSYIKNVSVWDPTAHFKYR